MVTKTENSKTAAPTRDSSQAQARQAAPFGPVAEMMGLHESVGNRAMRRVLQAKLTINQPGDKYEQEADRVAEMVMRMPEPGAVNGISQVGKGVQRKCAACASGSGKCSKCSDEEEKIQRKPLAASITPLVQRHENNAATPVVTPQIASQINGLRGGGQPLSESSRAFFEPRFGADFGGVRVHTNTPANETARQINARAYAIGQDIVFGSGQYSPESVVGKRLLAHELTHVVQQTQKVASNGSSSKILLKTNNNTSVPCPTPRDSSDLDAFCVTEASLSLPPKCQLTDKQKQILNTSTQSAADIVDKALTYVYPLYPEHQRHAIELANQIFGNGLITKIEGISNVLEVTYKILSNPGLKFQGVTCADQYCSDPRRLLTAYVSAPGKMPIFVCPKAFLDFSELTHTILHEAFHLAGIAHNVGAEEEKYCPSIFDCETPCGDNNSADAWTKFTNCLYTEGSLGLKKHRELLKQISGGPPSTIS